MNWSNYRYDMKKYILLLFLFLITSLTLSAQHVAVKHNFVGDAFLSPNLGLEIGLGGKTTLDLYGAYNPFGSKGDRFKHWLAQPELRYWMCDRFNGTFWGIHAIAGQFSVAGGNWPLPLSTFEAHRYEGNFYGGGISVGHQWILSNRWSLEGTIGVGYVHFDYDRYKCTNCSPKEKSGHYNYFGPTKAAVSLIYIIK